MGQSNRKLSSNYRIYGGILFALSLGIVVSIPLLLETSQKWRYFALFASSFSGLVSVFAFARGVSAFDRILRALSLAVSLLPVFALLNDPFVSAIFLFITGFALFFLFDLFEFLSSVTLLSFGSLYIEYFTGEGGIGRYDILALLFLIELVIVGIAVKREGAIEEWGGEKDPSSAPGGAFGFLGNSDVEADESGDEPARFLEKTVEDFLRGVSARGRAALRAKNLAVVLRTKGDATGWLAYVSREGSEDVENCVIRVDPLAEYVKASLILGREFESNAKELSSKPLITPDAGVELVFSYPVFSGLDPVGFIYGERDFSGELTFQDREVLSVLAAAVGKMFQVGKVVKDVRSVYSRYSLLADFIKVLPDMKGVKQVLSLTSEMIRNFLTASRVVVLLKVGEDNMFEIVNGGDERSGNVTVLDDDSILYWALRRGTPRIVKRYDRKSESIYRMPRCVVGEVKNQSIVIYPFAFNAGDEKGGEGLYVVVSNKPDAFTGEDVKKLEFLVDLSLMALPGAVKFDLLEGETRTDPMTGLANRRELMAALEREMKRAERIKKPLSILLIDIDHFKKINDTYGHPFGDEVIKGIARIMKTVVRPYDIVARYGGEEFAVLLVETGVRRAGSVAERIRTSVKNKHFEYKGERVRVTVSMGCSSFPEDGKVAEELLDMADKALYLSKKEGRDRVSFVRDLVRGLDR